LISIEPYIAILAQEPQREPKLGLAAIAPAERAADAVGRQIVTEPFRMLANDFGVAGADFLPEFAQHRHARVLPRVDPALRHLPTAQMARHVPPPRDQDLAAPIEQSRADIAAIGQFHR
jgi:hypothetical protein